jgi:ABC-type phosphate/phosphonate transport system substrate-binding protein
VTRHKFFASLPWYDFPEMRAANDALWLAIAGELRALEVRDVPSGLDRQAAYTLDHGAACFFTQTCGYPLLTTARDRFTVLGAPGYRVPGCTSSHYRSLIVVREDARVTTLEDLRGTRFAVNEADSNTGMNLPRRLFAPLARKGRFFARTILTGSHASSAALVDAGGADAAAVDCITFAFLQRYRPAAVRGLRVLAGTDSSPTPPFVTSRHAGEPLVAALRHALNSVVCKPEYASARDALFLTGIDFCGEDAYAVVLDYERDAQRLGYPELR